ncbi:hypothetical protein NQU17_05595 [Clostridiaceae bacterium HFYG-1003]|nr:hypothetical protein NQU17_05595 [Clostridiaceae bacterium HFYG-1003]
MPKNVELDHITIIVPQGQGEEVLKMAKQKGIMNGTVSKGLGTANQLLMKEFEKHGRVRDFVSLVAATDLAEIFLKKVAEEFGIGKPAHGIAYAVNVNEVYAERLSNVKTEDRNESDVQVITAIFRNGNADRVMDAARAAGATGGTILEDQSTVDPEMSLFSKGTNGNDEIVLIIARKEKAGDIMDAIRNNTGLDRTTGVIYVQDAHFVYGLKKYVGQE